MILSPTSQISHRHKVTYILMSPTSLSPVCPLNFDLNAEQQVSHFKRSCSPDLHFLISLAVRDEIADIVAEL